MLMVPVFIVLFFVEFPWHRTVALAVYAVACITDFLDGFIARKENLVTNLGKFLDPIADKILVACALIAVSVTEPVVEPKETYKICVAAFAMVIVCRELIVSGFRIIAADKGVTLAADIFGKIKTVLQMLALGALLLSSDLFEMTDPSVGTVFYYIGFALLAAATLMTIVSAVNYLVRNRQVLEDD